MGGERSSLCVAEEEWCEADGCGVGAVSLAGERLSWEGEEWWRGVTVMAVKVVGGAEAIGRIGLGGSTAASVAGVDVAGRGQWEVAVRTFVVLV